MLGDRLLHLLYVLYAHVADCVPLQRFLTTISSNTSFIVVPAIFRSIFGKLSKLQTLHLLRSAGVRGVDHLISRYCFLEDSMGRLQRGLACFLTRSHQVGSGASTWQHSPGIIPVTRDLGWSVGCCHEFAAKILRFILRYSKPFLHFKLGACEGSQGRVRRLFHYFVTQLLPRGLNEVES